MALTPEEQAELASLKAQLAQMPDDPAPAKPPGFWDEATSLPNTVESLMNVGKGMWQVASTGASAVMHPVDWIVDELMKAGSAAYQNPAGAANGLAHGITGFVPGLTTAADFLGDAVAGDIKDAGYYGKRVNQEAVGGGVGLVLGGAAGAAVGAAGGALTARAARGAAMESALADEGSQAALRFADNRGLLSTQSAQDALAAGKVTPEISDAAAVAQAEAVRSNQPASPQFPDVPGKDYLPGIAAGYPESSSTGRPFAASEDMARVGSTLIESGAYQGGERINPFTGKFEGPPSAPLDDIAFANKLEQASVDIIEARKQTVSALDQAMQAINRESPGAPKIRGVMFDADVAPMVEDLRGVVQKRAMLAQTADMSAEMNGAYQKIRDSFNAIENNSHMSRWNKIGPDGSFEKGELTPSETLSMIENMNAYRRAVGEFDEAARAQGLNSTFSSYTGRQAELYSMSKVQQAAQTALEGKAKEIVQLAPTLRGVYPMPDGTLLNDVIGMVQPDTLGIMNKNYDAFQVANEAATTHRNTTNRGMVTPEPGRLITAVNQGQESMGNQVVQAATNPVPYGVKKVVNGIWGDQPVNRALEAAQRNMQRPNAAISQVLDGLLLREKAVPILSRDWEKIRMDPSAMKELAMRGAMYGIMPFEQFEQMSDPVKQEVFKAVAQINPQGMEGVPGNLNIINGQYQNPMEKDAAMKQALDLPAHQRAKVIGGAFQNKYVPLSAPQTPVPEARTFNMERINSSLNEALNVPSFGLDSSYDHGTDSMLDRLEKMTSIHATNQ